MERWRLIPILIFTYLYCAPTITSAQRAIQWKPCNDSRLQILSAECAFVTVPLNYNRPRGTKICIAVSRVKHSSPPEQYQGVILVNPGGPGSSGLSLVSMANVLPSDVGSTYDWIGFDPRGVGSSQPSLSCQRNFLAGPRPNYDPRTQAEETYWLNRSHHYARTCEKKYSTLLKHMRSVDVVRDMEQIRRALRVNQINYYAYSYGTYLGQVYATMYPTRVRRMVLDSNPDPRHIRFQANQNQNHGFERNIKLWFAWIAKYDHIYHLGNKSCEVERHWLSGLKQLESNPAFGVIGPAEWIDLFLVAAYYQNTWIAFAQVLSNFINDKNSTALGNLYVAFGKGNSDNTNAVYLAVFCSDQRWHRYWRRVRTIYWRTFSQAPTFTWHNSWLNSPCHFWARRRTILSPVKVDGSRVGDILLIGETFDAATPYEGNLEVRRRFPRARLATVVNGTNHAYSLKINSCIDDIVAKYLRTGELPARKSGDVADIECEVIGEPRPFTSRRAFSKLDLEEIARTHVIPL